MNIQALHALFQNKFGVTLSQQELQELATVSDTTGRSPLRPRQLTDLRLLPRADDPRPTFFATAEAPRDWDTTAQHEYPKLMWSPQGTEVTIPPGKDADTHERDLEAQGYLHQPPADQSPLDAVAREMAQLSEDDRKLVLEMQRNARLARLEEHMKGLTDQELASVMQPAVKKGKIA